MLCSPRRTEGHPGSLSQSLRTLLEGTTCVPLQRPPSVALGLPRRPPALPRTQCSHRLTGHGAAVSLPQPEPGPRPLAPSLRHHGRRGATRAQGSPRTRSEPVPGSGQGAPVPSPCRGVCGSLPCRRRGVWGQREGSGESLGWGADTPSSSPCPHSCRRLAGLAASRHQGHPQALGFPVGGSGGHPMPNALSDQ